MLTTNPFISYILKQLSNSHLMKVAKEKVEFSFNKLLYRQIDSIAMGSPLGPTLENIFVDYLKYKIIPEIQCKYYRYVDDYCIITNNIIS